MYNHPYEQAERVKCVLELPCNSGECEGFVACCEAKGVQRDVSLFMLQDDPVSVDDFVLVHVGYAIQKITAQEAQSTWELLDQILEA